MFSPTSFKIALEIHQNEGENHQNQPNWWFPEIGVPPVIIHFLDGILHYKPSIFSSLASQECLGIGHSARVSVPNPLARIWPNGVVPNFLDNNMQLGEVL